MDRKENLNELREQGYNCAQCCLASCSDLTGLDRRTALAVAGGFGGGLRVGEVCGALSGAVMALGLCCPHTSPNSPDEKAKVGALSAEACERFKGEFGALTCRELVEKYGGKEMCPRFIEYSSELVFEIIEKNK